ncbi:MAG TPA: ABC transporter permease subunit [Bryobacterales bacterium]|nr:ABC transporter permease subunit [Bryobacterales bacterium]
MKSIWVLARRELSSYFSSPIAYIVLAMFAIIFGYFFYSATAIFVQYSIQAMMNRGMAGPMNLNEFIIRPLLMNVSVIILFLLPMVTMRLFAEEKRSGTIELLLTSPLRDVEIILGKWLAAMLLYVCLLVISALDILILFRYGQPDWKALLVGYLGLILMGAAFMGLGAFISTLTKNQIIAASLTFGLFLLLWVLDWVTSYSQGTVGKVVSYLSITTHFENFAKGVLDLKDAIYYLSVIFIGLFLTLRSMESLRWRA